MKNGISESALLEKAYQQYDSKKDFIAGTKAISMTEDAEFVDLANTRFSPTPIFHKQVAESLEIPQQFYHSMKAKYPDMLAYNVNQLFQRNPKKRMVRTLGDKARAFLSDSFRPLDNFDLLGAIYPTLEKTGAEVLSCQITDSRMYIKAVTHQIKSEIKLGDVVEMGVMISNSEVGMGAVRVEPFIYRLACTNGMTINELRHSRTHVGKCNAGELDASYEFVSNGTRELEDAAYFSKVRDIVEGTFTQVGLDRLATRFLEASERPLPNDIERVIEVTSKRLGLFEGERSIMLNHLIHIGDLSQWGLANAVTRTAEDVESYDRATELERLGGDVAMLPARDWNQFVSAVR